MRRVWGMAGVMLLAGCHSGPTIKAENASVAEVAEKAKAIRFEPGEWSNKTEVLAFDFPGAKDPRVAAMIGDAMKKAQSRAFNHCLTPEEAAKPNAGMFQRDAAKDCRYEKFEMADGRISGTLVCKPPSGGDMHMSMDGSYSATGYDMTVDMKMAGGPMPGEGMTMKAHTKGERIGECKGGAQ